MRKKQNTLASYGQVRFERANTAHDVRRVLEVFFKQKRARMRAMGVPDVFAAPSVRRFIEAAATEQDANHNPPIELYSLSVDDIIVATMGGIVGGGRFCAMFNSIVQSRFEAESPGEQMIVNLVRSCCERGLETFDLGIGEAHYKSLFCGDPDPLFDSYLPLSSAGHFVAATLATGANFKRAIKRHPTLWSMARKAQRLRAWFSTSA
jgi:CelD/BcsL family acetyltransferase involved in cellulose biosynthesis